MRYKADLTAGALKVAESRIIADLLLRGVDDAGWRRAIYDENVLQARSPKTAKRLRTLVRNRLETMTDALWRLVRDGTSDEATHACLAAAVKHSYLLGDFLDLVVREQYQTVRRDALQKAVGRLRRRLPGPRSRHAGVERVHHRAAAIVRLSDPGRSWLHRRCPARRSSRPSTLSSRCCVISEKHDEQYVLRCIQVGP